MWMLALSAGLTSWVCHFWKQILPRSAGTRRAEVTGQAVILTQAETEAMLRVAGFFSQGEHRSARAPCLPIRQQKVVAGREVRRAQMAKASAVASLMELPIAVCWTVLEI